MYKISKLKPKKAAVIVLILFYITGLGICFAQTSSPYSNTTASNAKDRLNTKVTYSCENLPMEAVLKELAELGKVYIVKSPRVTGDVSIDIVDVPLEEVLTNILGAYDYTYIATENMIRVVPLSELVISGETLVTRIYKITYADVGEVTAALKEFLSTNGKASFNKGTSHIIVTDTEDKIRAIDKFIDEIDRITSQVLVEVRIYDITSNEAFKINPEWSIQRNTPEVITNYEDMTSHRQGVDPINLNEVDVQTDQWNDSQGDPQFPATAPYDIIRDTKSKTYQTQRRKPLFGGSFNRINGGTIHISLLDNAVDLDFVLSMLHSTVEAKLLANPRILVLDNETANFEIIREVPYREIRQVAREDPVTYTDFKNVGVQLKVTPHIARDGMIILKIEPEFGVLVGHNMIDAVPTTRIADGTTMIPVIDTRRAKTTTLISDGQTIVLGGLRKKELKKTVDKMPFLGDMPLLGGLFRAEREEEETRELVVFITTRIITNPTLTKAEQIQYNDVNFPSPKTSELNRLKQSRRYSRAQAAKKKKTDADKFIKEWMKKAKTTYPEQ